MDSKSLSPVLYGAEDAVVQANVGGKFVDYEHISAAQD
jgi:hypothetical protein